MTANSNIHIVTTNSSHDININPQTKFIIHLIYCFKKLKS